MMLDDTMEQSTLELNKSRGPNRSLSIILVKPTVESIQDWFNDVVNEAKLTMTTRRGKFVLYKYLL